MKATTQVIGWSASGHNMVKYHALVSQTAWKAVVGLEYARATCGARIHHTTTPVAVTEIPGYARPCPKCLAKVEG